VDNSRRDYCDVPDIKLAVSELASLYSDSSLEDYFVRQLNKALGLELNSWVLDQFTGIVYSN